MQLNKDCFTFEMAVDKDSLSEFEKGFILGKMPDGTSLDDRCDISIVVTMYFDGNKMSNADYQICVSYDECVVEHDCYQKWYFDFEPDDSLKAEIFRRLMLANSSYMRGVKNR